MHNIFKGVSDAYPLTIDIVRQNGVQRTSRNGSVFEMPTPVMTTFTDLKDRVLLDPHRKANPFLHLVDAMYVLTDRNDHAPLSRIVKRMASFSTDGTTLDGAYGHRLQKFFGHNQLIEVVRKFSRDITDRRQVMSLWHPNDLLNTGSKDLPCNIAVLPRIVNGKMNLTVLNRSNDVFWGLLGANMPQFAFLNEFLASACQVDMGENTHLSNNLHMYTDFGVYPTLAGDWHTLMTDSIDRSVDFRRAYSWGRLRHMPLMDKTASPTAFLGALGDVYDDIVDETLQNRGVTGYAFIDEVFRPMMTAHELYRSGDADQAIMLLEKFDDRNNWIHAGKLWLNAHSR